MFGFEINVSLYCGLLLPKNIIVWVVLLDLMELTKRTGKWRRLLDESKRLLDLFN